MRRIIIGVWLKNTSAETEGQKQNDPLAQLATDVFAAPFARFQPHRAHLADDESTLVQFLPDIGCVSLFDLIGHNNLN